MNREKTHFDHDVFYLLEDYKSEIGIEYDQEFSEEEFGASFGDWLFDQGYFVDYDNHSIESETNIIIPEIIDYVPITVSPQLEERLQYYLKSIFFLKVCFLSFTFENYLDVAIPEPFDFRESEKGQEIGRYYFLVDDYGNEIVS